MGTLKGSLELERELLAKSTGEFKTQVKRFIEANCNVKGISNLIYRNNLHILIDRVNSPELLEQLKSL